VERRGRCRLTVVAESSSTWLRHCEERSDEAIQSRASDLDCFAPLAMTHSRDAYASESCKQTVSSLRGAKRRSNPVGRCSTGLLRGACHRTARLRAGPLARNDAFSRCICIRVINQTARNPLPPQQQKEEDGAPTGALNHGPRHTFRCCHLKVLRARKRATSPDVAIRKCCGRARLSALRKRLLPRRPNALTQPRPRFTRTNGCRRYPHHRPRLSDAPRTPVVVPEGTMPRPPGSGITSPARRNRTRPVFRSVPREHVPQTKGEIR
jgi:hypothetical protein